MTIQFHQEGLLTQDDVVEDKTGLPVKIYAETEADLSGTQIRNGCISFLEGLLAKDEVSGGHVVLDKYAALLDSIAGSIERRKGLQGGIGPGDTVAVVGSAVTGVRIKLTYDIEVTAVADDVVVAPEVLTGIVDEFESNVNVVLFGTCRCCVPVIPYEGIVGD
jgi:hypothetical protein